MKKVVLFGASGKTGKYIMKKLAFRSSLLI